MPVTRIPIALVAVAACSDGPAPLTCQVVTAAATCIAEQATALEACMPMRAMMATEIDASTCKFSDGVAVEFSDFLVNIAGQYPTPIELAVVAPDGVPCGYLRSDASQDRMLLEVIGALPGAGASWFHNRASGTLDFVCGAEAQHYQTDLVDGACSVAEPSFTFSDGVGNPYILTLTTAATSGSLFTCQ